MAGIQLDDMFRAHDQFIRGVRSTIQSGLVEMALAVKEHVINDRSFGGDQLRHSVQFRFRSTNTIQTYTNAKHASYVNDGTKPHQIVPKRKKFLAWSDSSGRRFFAKKVSHPGTKPTQFWQKANQQGFEIGSQFLTRELSQLKF